MRLLSGLRTNSVLFAVLAMLAAAGLALYLQHRALTTLQAQHAVILEQVAARTATAIVADVRRTLEGPVFDTLTRVNHPQLREGRFDLVAREYENGLREYPQVERFFLWSAQTDQVLPGEMMFYGSAAASGATPAGTRWPGFYRDPALGRALVKLAERHADSQQIYVAGRGVGPGRHEAFLRLFWDDARRTSYFAVLGFIVDPGQFKQRFFPELHKRRLETLLNGNGGEPFALRVLDETGAAVFGDGAPTASAARVQFPLLFYPAQAIRSRLAAAINPVEWTVEVNPPARGPALAATSQRYWLPLLSVLLMALALACTIHAHRRSVELARLQADFISHVSHQLKTPLSLLSAATETLTMERVRSPEKLAEYLSIIRAEVTRLSALVQRILEFSRVQQQRRGLERERIDLGALVRETADAFQRSLSGQRFAFHVEQHGPSPIVDADPAALEQIVVNLLDNAVKYSDQSRDVTIAVRRAGHDAVIEVTDRGIGIPDNERERIFDKFFRGSGAAVCRQGFGLGLPIASELVAAHRGRLEVDSTLGQGSTFRVHLPAEVAR
jgi:signal transduction histidine kinase